MAGRPTKYHSKYCTMLMEHMKQGLSIESFAAVIGVSKQTLYTWKEVYPEFLDAIKKGEAESLLFWETLGMGGLTGRIPGFNAAIWIFNMKNRFKWTDRADINSREAEENVDYEKELEKEDPGEVLKRILDKRGHRYSKVLLH